MAYKFQLGAARLSGSLTQEGAVTAESAALSGSEINVGSANLSETDLEQIDGITAGTAAASKALVLDSSSDIDGIRRLTGVTRVDALERVKADGASGGKAELDIDSNNGRLRIDNSDDERVISLDVSSLAGRLRLFNDGGSVVHASMIAGVISGSGNLTMAGSGSFGDGLSLGDASGIADDGLKNANGKLAVDIASLGAAVTDKGDVDDTDELALNDGGITKRIDFSVLRNAVYADVSGDATVADGGALTIGANAVEGSMINSNAAGDGLSYGSNAINIDAAQTDITSVLNNSLKVGRGDGNDTIDFGTDDTIKFFIDGTNSAAEQMRIASGSVTVFGDLFVSGSTTTIDSANVLLTGSFVFEGSTPDGNETTLRVVDPTADRTIQLPNAAGTIPVFTDSTIETNAFGHTATELNILDGATVTTAELNLLDGSAKSTSSITLADADAIIVIDGSTTKQIPASDIKTYVGSSTNLAVALKDNSETLANGVNYFANFSGAEAVNLPASPDVGDVVHIKAPANCSSTNKLTINRQGSHTIDGETSVILESPNAAIMCVYVVANVWKIF